jgi:DNA-binding CsgD family transcriptional regulator
MLKSAKGYLRCLIVLLGIVSFNYVTAQKLVTDEEDLARLMASEDNSQNDIFNESINVIMKGDSATVFNQLARLEKKFSTSNLYYKARFKCYLAWAKIGLRPDSNISEIAELTTEAMNFAFTTNDKNFIAYISWLCGSVMFSTPQFEAAVTFRLKVDDIYHDIGYPVYYDSIGNWVVLGEALFHTGDYDESIVFTKGALRSWQPTADQVMDNRIRFYNTIGQDFEQLNKLDSAIVYFDSSLALAEKTQQHVWTGISSGYKGEVLFKLNEYRKAKPLLEIDYAINKNIEEDIAAKSLQWLARIDLAEGKNDSALVKSSEALQVLSKAEFNYYLQRDRIREMCYYTLAESYKAINKVDSFEYYDQLKINLHDSLARIALESSMRMLQTKIANENIQHAVKELQAERASEAKKRNLVIAGVVLLAAMFILYIKRVKLKQQHRADLLLREKRMAETELASAREQLQQFTTGIIEKTNLIEKLNLQIEGKDPNTYGQRMLDELINKTTLTESTWENFKATFEKIHPNFFASLKEKAANITMAEQRMAALIKLNLNARQMATILGISVDSVHKAKQRLRQRMQVQNEIMLEETLADL